MANKPLATNPIKAIEALRESFVKLNDLQPNACIVSEKMFELLTQFQPNKLKKIGTRILFLDMDLVTDSELPGIQIAIDYTALPCMMWLGLK